MNLENQQRIVTWIVVSALLVSFFIIIFSREMPAVAPAPTPNYQRSDSTANFYSIASILHRKQENCVIKGNVSYKTGEKIYHLPGDAYYDRTVINEAYGERWFCIEAEAHAAGWRRTYR